MQCVHYARYVQYVQYVRMYICTYLQVYVILGTLYSVSGPQYLQPSTLYQVPRTKYTKYTQYGIKYSHVFTQTVSWLQQVVIFPTRRKRTVA